MNSEKVSERATCACQLFHALPVLLFEPFPIPLLGNDFDPQIYVAEPVYLRPQHAAEQDNRIHPTEEIRIAVNPIHPFQKTPIVVIATDECDRYVVIDGLQAHRGAAVTRARVSCAAHPGRKRLGGRLSGLISALLRKILAAWRSRGLRQVKSTVWPPLSTGRNRYIQRPANRTKVHPYAPYRVAANRPQGSRFASNAKWWCDPRMGALRHGYSQVAILESAHCPESRP